MMENDRSAMRTAAEWPCSEGQRWCMGFKTSPVPQWDIYIWGEGSCRNVPCYVNVSKTVLYV